MTKVIKKWLSYSILFFVTVGSLGVGEEAAFGLGRKGPGYESLLFSHIFTHNILCLVVVVPTHRGAKRIYP